MMCITYGDLNASFGSSCLHVSATSTSAIICPYAVSKWCISCKSESHSCSCIRFCSRSIECVRCRSGLAPPYSVPCCVSESVVIDPDRMLTGVTGLLRGFTSSRGIFGPPARLQATPCLTQFVHGFSSSHYVKGQQCCK